MNLSITNKPFYDRKGKRKELIRVLNTYFICKTTCRYVRTHQWKLQASEVLILYFFYSSSSSGVLTIRSHQYPRWRMWTSWGHLYMIPMIFGDGKMSLLATSQHAPGRIICIFGGYGLLFCLPPRMDMNMYPSVVWPSCFDFMRQPWWWRHFLCMRLFVDLGNKKIKINLK